VSQHEPGERRELPFEPMFVSEAQRAVFDSLSDDVVAVLVAVQQRLQEVTDVEAHLMGATFW
jgi:hypothetical protein